jgi:hypothetical protein
MAGIRARCGAKKKNRGIPQIKQFSWSDLQVYGVISASGKLGEYFQVQHRNEIHLEWSINQLTSPYSGGPMPQASLHHKDEGM